MIRTGVYILLCSNGKYYVGSSEDIDRRIEEHQRGKTKSLKYVLPVELKAFIECKTGLEARQLEYKIKKMKIRKYVEELVEKFGIEG